MTCESVAIDTDSRKIRRGGASCAETCGVGRPDRGSSELSRSAARQKRIREDFDLLTERSSFHFAKPRADKENDNPDDRADRHDDQLKAEVQLVKNQQGQKRHRGNLQRNSKVMQHRICVLKRLKSGDLRRPQRNRQSGSTLFERRRLLRLGAVVFSRRGAEKTVLNFVLQTVRVLRDVRAFLIGHKKHKNSQKRLLWLFVFIAASCFEVWLRPRPAPGSLRLCVKFFTQTDLVAVSQEPGPRC
jgi:hypothetical protein